jgi:hypothetical protein
MASSSHVKPNEKGTISVKINTAGRNGLIVENVEVTSSDPMRPQVTLTIRAYVSDFYLPFLPK